MSLPVAAPLLRRLCALLPMLLAAPVLTATAADRPPGVPAPLPADPSARATLELTVSGLDGSAGTVYLAVYDSPAAFPKPEGMRARVRATVSGTQPLTVSVPDLPPGRYAVAAYHDQNGNGRFDQGLFGFPLEGFGFTRDPSVFPSAPVFEDAAIAVTAPLTRTTIRMRYGL